MLLILTLSEKERLLCLCLRHFQSSHLRRVNHSKFWCTNAKIFCVNLRTSGKVYEHFFSGQPLGFYDRRFTATDLPNEGQALICAFYSVMHQSPMYFPRCFTGQLYFSGSQCVSSNKIRLSKRLIRLPDSQLGLCTELNGVGILQLELLNSQRY